jgi:hypothetical protein
MWHYPSKHPVRIMCDCFVQRLCLRLIFLLVSASFFPVFGDAPVEVKYWIRSARNAEIRRKASEGDELFEIVRPTVGESLEVANFPEYCR